MSNTKLAIESQIHIALSPWDLTDDYNRHAGVTLLSALEHCSQPATVHLLYDAKFSIGKEREEAYNKSCYQKIAEKYSCQIQYHHVELPEWINTIPSVKKWTPGTLMRLCLPDILNTNIDKILYFDCDMVVNTNIDVLCSLPIDEYYLAAVKDTSTESFGKHRKKQYQRLNIPFDSYFCAGTIILNLKKIRSEDIHFSEMLFNYLYENQNLPFLDQDMLNWFCQGSYLELDEKYNIYSDRPDAIQYIDDAIIHYIGRYKPWKAYLGDIDNPYWEYLIQTPWCEDKKNLIKYIRNSPDIEKCFNILPNYVLALKKYGRRTRVINTIKLISSIVSTLITESMQFLKR